MTRLQRRGTTPTRPLAGRTRPPWPAVLSSPAAVSDEGGVRGSTRVADLQFLRLVGQPIGRLEANAKCVGQGRRTGRGRSAVEMAIRTSSRVTQERWSPTRHFWIVRS